PNLSEHVTLASYCAIDGYANSTLTGKAFRAALEREGVDVREGWSVEGVERDGGGFALRGAGKSVRARRIVLAGGVWLKKMGAWLGIDLPVECRVPQVVVTERMGPVMGPIIGVANKLLTLKQAANGTILIGGGWPGIGDTDVGGIHAIPKSIVANVRLARHAIPAIGRARIMRTWLGLAAAGPDWLPLVGDLPGVADAFVIGAARSGFTHGPFLGKLLAQHILGQEPEMPLFDPATRIAGPADPLLPGR
ncbi:MAG: FAD-binding oxidoreductase, partial [Rhodospirillales bacterium]|nr:FAD-binding oxidoreductase [Rhodospirillales bacterium]